MSYTNIGKEINALTLENCIKLRGLGLPCTGPQQEWMIAEIQRLRDLLDVAGVSHDE